MLPLLKGDWEKAKGIADEAVPVSIWQDTKELHIKVQNLDLKKKKKDKVPLFYLSHIQAITGIWTWDRIKKRDDHSVNSVTFVRKPGSFRGSTHLLYIKSNLHECTICVWMHPQISLHFLTVSFLFGCEKKPFMDTRLCQKHIKVSNSYWTGEGGRKKKKKKERLSSDMTDNVIILFLGTGRKKGP